MERLLKASFTIEITSVAGAEAGSADGSLTFSEFLAYETQTVERELAARHSSLTLGRQAFSDTIRQVISSLAEFGAPAWLETRENREHVRAWLRNLVNLPVEASTSLPEFQANIVKWVQSLPKEAQPLYTVWS